MSVYPPHAAGSYGPHAGSPLRSCLCVHRHMHSGMGGMDQNFHKDGHHIPMRHHRPRWIMGMYFCTDVTIEMVRS
jgi:hypothetical protein